MAKQGKQGLMTVAEVAPPPTQLDSYCWGRSNGRKARVSMADPEGSSLSLSLSPLHVRAQNTRLLFTNEAAEPPDASTGTQDLPDHSSSLCKVCAVCCQHLPSHECDRDPRAIGDEREYRTSSRDNYRREREASRNFRVRPKARAARAPRTAHRARPSTSPSRTGKERVARHVSNPTPTTAHRSTHGSHGFSARPRLGCVDRSLWRCRLVGLDLVGTW